jgi:EthD domain
VIQFFALIPRAASVNEQEFHDHWRHPHGTMGNRIASMRSYVQGHRVHTALIGDAQAGFDGIAITKFDSLEEALGFGTEPQYVDHVQPDEPNFVGEGLLWLHTTEDVLVGRAKIQDGASYADALWNELDLPVSTMLLQFVRPGTDGWAGTDDAELGKRIGALRHVRNPAHPDAQGGEPTFIGARQLWWPTLTAFESGVGADRAAFDELIGRGGPDAVTVLVQAERFLR